MTVRAAVSSDEVTDDVTLFSKFQRIISLPLEQSPGCINSQCPLTLNNSLVIAVSVNAK